jgi:hypothetical protein
MRDRRDLGEADVSYYLLDGEPVLLDADRGPLTASGQRVDCVAWMDRAVSVGRDEYLAAILGAGGDPARADRR